MVSKRFTEEFKLEIINQITERLYLVMDISVRLGASYDWVKKYDQPEPVIIAAEDQLTMIQHL